MIVRILIDGYNLLHAWKTLAAASERYSETARSELIKVLTEYYDSNGTPITLIFDGRSPGALPEREPSTYSRKSDPNIEVLYTPSKQSADQLIERATLLYKKYGEVMAVTNDNAIRDLVIGAGGSVCSCDNFVLSIRDSSHEMRLKLKYHNWDTNNRFKS